MATDILEESQDGYDAGTKIVENRVNGITIKETHYNPEGKMILVKEFGKDGKATASYNFFPDGKMSSVNTYGKPFGDMLDIEVIRKKGDMLEHVVNENDVAYMHGRIKIGDAIHEIGWTLKENNECTFIEHQHVQKEMPRNSKRMTLCETVARTASTMVTNPS